MIVILAHDQKKTFPMWSIPHATFSMVNPELGRYAVKGLWIHSSPALKFTMQELVERISFQHRRMYQYQTAALRSQVRYPESAEPSC